MLAYARSDALVRRCVQREKPPGARKQGLAGRIKATPHRVIGTDHERISVPLFFNPNHDTNVAPKGAAESSALAHLEKRYQETYVHLQEAAKA